MDPALTQPLVRCFTYWAQLSVSKTKLFDHVDVKIPWDGDSYLEREGAMYETLKVLLPPEMGDEEREMQAAYDRVEHGGRQSIDRAKLHILKSWHVNASLFVSSESSDSGID